MYPELWNVLGNITMNSHWLFIQEGPRLAKHTYTTKSPLLQWKCVERVGEVDGQRRLNPEGDTWGEIWLQSNKHMLQIQFMWHLPEMLPQ